ncbi:HAD family hydrolase [Sphingomonas spermidinifaciens]|uniref:HAD family hydrolase n=1 Tax=Sphingomonas spermidinifaciens TaxID=1141889 RepID=A0A2A4B447_9SPHN|nr:HAD-IA family hydrolase [Sphingomonas spermidinifaciens]PCD02518.1 HAD family hydrolase [Sphingomonas spermidinifaciens]
MLEFPACAGRVATASPLGQAAPVPPLVPPADPPIRLVIFDFDGTLADSGHWFLGIVDHLAQRYRFRTVEAGEVERLRALPTREVIRHLRIPAWKLPFIARYVRTLFALHTHEVQLFDGVSEMLAALEAAEVRLALVTSNAEINARRILGPENAARFAIWECASSLYGKAPRFRRVLKAAGVSPAEAVAIGDETRDIEAARRCGIRSGAVHWGYAHREALDELAPDYGFDSPDAVIRLLAQQASAPAIAGT